MLSLICFHFISSFSNEAYDDENEVVVVVMWVQKQKKNKIEIYV